MAEPARYAESHAKGAGSAISTVLHRLASDLGKLVFVPLRLLPDESPWHMERPSTHPWAS